MRGFGVTEALAPAVPEAAIPLLVLLTAFGGPKLIAIVSIVGSSTGVWTERVELPRARRFLVGIGLVLSASIFLKHGLAMPRPPAALMAIPEDGFGFPSGHATAAAGLATAILRSSTRVERWQYGLGIGYVSLIAATRVLLGVHYLVDVLAGVGVGIFVAAGGIRAARSRQLVAEIVTVLFAAAALTVWLLA